jgi:hypothetical protein
MVIGNAIAKPMMLVKREIELTGSIMVPLVLQGNLLNHANHAALINATFLRV